MPELYNQHYINKYSFPKGLIACRKDKSQTTTDKKPRQSIYDMYAQPVRKGVSGWKLTKRIVTSEETAPKPKKQFNNAQNAANKGQKQYSVPNGYNNYQSRQQAGMMSNDLAGFSLADPGLNTNQGSSNLNVRSTQQSLDQLGRSEGNFQFANNNIQQFMNSPQNMVVSNSGGMMGNYPIDAVGHPVARDENTTASDDRRRSQMKATFAGNGGIDAEQLHSEDQVAQPYHGNNINQDMIHSMHE